MFIDDSKDNIEVGKTFGMDGYVFRGNVTMLREWLEEKGILKRHKIE